jgi:phage terminase small subunit
MTKRIFTPVLAPVMADPPAHLSERAKGLWREIVLAGRVKSSGRVVLFQAALEALDRADLARETIASEGMTSTSKLTGVMHIHPLVKIEIEARRQFASMWETLGLRWDPSIDAKIGW